VLPPKTMMIGANLVRLADGGISDSLPVDFVRSGLGATHAWVAVAWYVAVAGSTVAIPILAYAVSGDRLDEPLRRLKDWMERQHATLVAAILVVIGLLVLYKGIHGL
jgi:hypothetical protein